VAVGRLIGLDRAQLAEAIRISSALSVSTNYQVVRDGATARNLWAGMGNFVAIVAAQSARSGFSGPQDGPACVFGETLGVSFDREIASDGLGSDWYLGRNYFKLYACCRHAHASIDAFRTIVDDIDISAGDIDRIEVYTYARAAVAVGQPDYPKTPLAAKFSIPYIFSVYLKTGSAGREVFEAPFLTDPSLFDVAAKVTVTEDPDYTAKLPATRAARVTVHFTDGQSQTTEAMGSRGDPHDPLSLEEITDKFLTLAVPEIGQPASESVLKAVVSIESLKDVAILINALNGK
jgi:2-methylcitrate dehydratase PrpD